MVVDLHGQAQRIVEALSAEGLHGEPDALRNAIEVGATGLEIWMAVRWHLRRIEGRRVVSSSSTRQQIRDLSRVLDDALAG